MEDPGARWATFRPSQANVLRQRSLRVKESTARGSRHEAGRPCVLKPIVLCSLHRYLALGASHTAAVRWAGPHGVRAAPARKAAHGPYNTLGRALRASYCPRPQAGETHALPACPAGPTARPLTFDQLVVVVLQRRALLGHGRRPGSRPLQPPLPHRGSRLRTAYRRRVHGARHRRAPLVCVIAARRAGGSRSWWAQMAAAEAAAHNDPGPAQELLVAWNTVSTGLVPPAALGLVRPEKRAAGPCGVPGTLRVHFRVHTDPSARFCPTCFPQSPFLFHSLSLSVGPASVRRRAAGFP